MQSRNDPVLLSVQDGVAQVRFNRPAALNAIDQPLADRFLQGDSVRSGPAR